MHSPNRPNSRNTQRTAFELCKRALYIQKRALNICIKAWDIRKGALYVRKRALYVRKQAHSTESSEESIQKGNHLSSAKDLYSFSKEPYISAKKPCISVKEPHTCIRSLLRKQPTKIEMAVDGLDTRWIPRCFLCGLMSASVSNVLCWHLYDVGFLLRGMHGSRISLLSGTCVKMNIQIHA